MLGSFTMDGSNIQNILLLLVVIGLGAYVFLEIRKLKGEISQLKQMISQTKLNVPVSSRVFAPPIVHPPIIPMKDISEDVTVADITPSETSKESKESKESELVSVSVVDSNTIKTDELENTSEELSHLMMSEEEYDDYDPAYEPETKESTSETTKRSETPDDIELFQKPKENPYKGLSVSELKSKLTEMNLPTSGNKNKLVQRILDNE